MRKFHFWTSIVTGILAVIFLTLMIIYESEIRILSIFSSFFVSLIILFFTSLSQYIYFNISDKFLYRKTITELLNPLAKTIEIINYSVKKSDSKHIIGFNSGIEAFILFSNTLQNFYVSIMEEKIPDYYKLNDLIKRVVIKVKRLNDMFSVLHNTEEKVIAFNAIKEFIVKDKDLEEFMLKVASIQTKDIVYLNEESFKK